MLTFLLQSSRKSQGLRVLMPITAVMVLAGACVKTQTLPMPEKQCDSLCIHVSSVPGYSHLDIFIYSDSLDRPLEQHFRCDKGQSIKLPCYEGEKIIVGLANLRGEFGELLPRTYEAMENLSMRYADEDPSQPFQSGICYLQGGSTAELKLSPLLCPIHINDICMEGDAPLCDPVASLQRVNAEIPILRMDGFHPSRTLDGPEGLDFPLMMMQALPFDIAAVPQRAGITLYCYPNEDEQGLSGGGTELLISGFQSGEPREFCIPLGKISRSGAINLDLELQ